MNDPPRIEHCAGCHGAGTGCGDESHVGCPACERELAEVVVAEFMSRWPGMKRTYDDWVAKPRITWSNGQSVWMLSISWPSYREHYWFKSWRDAWDCLGD